MRSVRDEIGIDTKKKTIGGILMDQRLDAGYIRNAEVIVQVITQPRHRSVEQDVLVKGKVLLLQVYERRSDTVSRKRDY